MPGEHGSGPVTAVGEPLHQRLARVAPELVSVVRDRVLTELPAYSRLPDEQVRGDITRIIRRSIRAFIEVVRTGERPSPEFLASLRESIAQRAEEGVPIDVVLTAHHLGVRASWESLGADAEPADLPDLLALGRLQLAYLQDVTAAVSAGYSQERQARFSEDQAARQALLSALLEGSPGTEAAARAGVRPPPAYLVLDVLIGPHPDEHRSTVDEKVAARRKLRRVGAELERAAALSALTPGGGTVLVPVGSEEPSEAEWDRLAELVDGVARAAGADVLAGVVAAAPAGVPAAVVQAREILEVVSTSGQAPGAYRLDDVLLEYQLSRPGPAREKLAALLEPLSARPELLETLRAYFRNGLNRRCTARKLHIHPNTVDYRLRRIAALTGLDTTDAAELPRIRAALSARQAAAEAPPRGGGGARTSDRVAGDAGR